MDKMRARMPAALEPLFNWSTYGSALKNFEHIENAAGFQRRHVFDFEDGIRMIVTREIHVLCGHSIHLSFGAQPASPDYRKWSEFTVPFRALEISRELFDFSNPPALRFSSASALHYHFPIEREI